MRKRFCLFVFFIFFCTVENLFAEILIPPNDSNVNYYGRFDSTSATAYNFNWPGSTIEACFPGPSIGVELGSGATSCYFNVEIDGVLVDSLVPNTATHRTIRTNLSTSNHTIRIILRNEDYTCSFGGFYIVNGSKLVKLAKPARKIEFIGDSWTAGYEDGSATTADNKYCNAALSYGRVTSRAFYAQDHITARRGCGMAISLSGDPTMPTRFPKTLMDGTALWNFTKWAPDVVTIFLGINDYNSGVTDANFKTAYTGFINTVRSKYANVPVICIAVNDLGNIYTDVQQVAAGFTNVTVMRSPITFAAATALWNHPSVAQQHIIADSLIRRIKGVTGWDTIAPTGVVATPSSQIHGNDLLHVKSVGANIWQISLNDSKKNALSSIDIFSVSGKHVTSLILGKNGIAVWDASHVSAGLYFTGQQTTGWKQIVVSASL